MTTVIVLAKAPLPGRVKTRLSPPFTPVDAARLAEAALADTLETVLNASSARPVLALDGAPGGWLPPGFTVIPQVRGDLDARIVGAFCTAAKQADDGRAGPALLIGMDTPQVTPALLRPDWAGVDAVFGPARDGGFWALGFREADAATIRRTVLGVPMSQHDTGLVQLARLRAATLRTRLLPALRDIDTAADAFAVAKLCPRGRFARVLRETTTGSQAAGATPAQRPQP